MYDILKEILINDLHLTEEDIRPEASRDEAGLDSLAMVELSMVLSKRLSIEISDDELIEAATVADLAHLIGQRSTRV
ncbi:acyl carrier protein [Streptomyces sp. NPDC097640]|uniref:acyl carrier protein n=1 Tax=Streptomyces sp. NPDC097640 TaxID=3157229 RepID=UPI00331BE0B1